MLLVYIYVALASYNTGFLTLPLSSIETIIDDAANVATLDGKGTMKSSYKKGPNLHGVVHKPKAHKEKEKDIARDLDWRSLWMTGTDAVSIPYLCLDISY